MSKAQDEARAPDDWAPSLWKWDGRAFSDWVRRWVDHDAFVVWLVEPGRPEGDGLLACTGVDVESAAVWLERAAYARKLLEQMMSAGAWAGAAETLGLPVRAQAAVGGCWIAPAQRFGLLALALRPSEFRDAELDALRWMAAALHSRLTASEAGISRLLLGGMGRLLYADPICRLQAISEGLVLAELIERIERIRRQRWPELPPGGEADMVIPVGSEPRWVAVQRRRAVELDAADHWLVELRRMDEGLDLPIVEELEDDRLAMALRYIHERYAESPPLGSMAEASGMSPYHFHRVFVREVGVSPRRYLQLRQLQMAKWRLRTERTTIGQIAEESGFANHGHFASAFRRAAGVSPMRYRERWIDRFRAEDG